MTRSSSSGSDASRVHVQPEKRREVDMAKLAAALIELATEQLEAEAVAAANNSDSEKAAKRQRSASRGRRWAA